MLFVSVDADRFAKLPRFAIATESHLLPCIPSQKALTLIPKAAISGDRVVIPKPPPHPAFFDQFGMGQDLRSLGWPQAFRGLRFNF